MKSKQEKQMEKGWESVADYFGYIPTMDYHNSLGDVMATLYCYQKIMER